MAAGAGVFGQARRDALHFGAQARGPRHRNDQVQFRQVTRRIDQRGAVAILRALPGIAGAHARTAAEQAFERRFRAAGTYPRQVVEHQHARVLVFLLGDQVAHGMLEHRQRGVAMRAEGVFEHRFPGRDAFGRERQLPAWVPASSGA